MSAGIGAIRRRQRQLAFRAGDHVAYMLAILGQTAECWFDPAIQEDQSGSATVNAIVRNFGESIWATFTGLAAAVILIFLNRWIEPAFSRLSENREHVRDMVARAKRELAMSATTQAANDVRSQE